jgi:amino acid adenylation domain-containing protein
MMKNENLQGYRLSPQQRWLWLTQREGAACRVQAAVDLTGALDVAVLEEAVRSLVDRHEILRTIFRRAPGVKVPLQSVAAKGSPDWSVGGLAHPAGAEQESALAELCEREARRAFDLERGPMLRVQLIALGGDRHTLLVSLPGLCADGWTLKRMLAEIGEAYAARRAGGTGTRAGESEGEGEPVQYLQFSEWQYEQLEGESDSAGRAYWRRLDPTAFHGLRLPLEDPSGAARTALPARVSLPFEPAMRAGLSALGATVGADLPTTLIAIWEALLFRLTRQPVVAVGEVLDGRRIAELQGTCGPFARTVPVACSFSDGSRIGEILEEVLQSRLAAITRQELFLGEELIDATEAARNPPVAFEVDELPAAGTWGDLRVSVRDWRVSADRFRVKLLYLRTPADPRLDLLYDSRLFREEDARRLADRFIHFATAVLAAPQTRLGDLAIVGADELARVTVELNQTAVDLPLDRTFHRLFAEQAARTPGRIAIVADGTELTYDDLDLRANRLAHHLRSLGVGAEVRVALCLRRSPALLVAILGVLKAGGSYVPLDPTYPAGRLAFMLGDAAPRVLLTEEALVPILPDAAVERLLLDRMEILGRQPASAPAEVAEPGSLAYVMYTSGSTGNPKGVMVPHRGLVNYLTWSRSAYSLEEGSGSLVHSPIAFDFTVTSLLAPLLAGGRVVLLPEDGGVGALSTALRQGNDFTLVKVTPAHLQLLRQQMIDDGLPGKMRVLVVGGEALTASGLERFQKHAEETRLVNEYGPTETVVGSIAYEVPPGAPLTGAVPIGRPIANTRVYLVEGELQPVPLGAPGELLIGGAGVTRGYLGQPVATALSFIPDPFGDGERLYRTGDLVRYLRDGNLEFVGREDGQVKVRGYRVETGEIEATFLRHPGIREAVVMVREDTPGDRRLVAYLIGAQRQAPRVDELRRYLSESLPDHMVPSAFVILPAFPLTLNGKLDRRALPAPGPERPELDQEYVAPRTSLEEVLATIWVAVLGVDRVGIHDSFFALGGDSIRSVRVVALAKERGLEFVIQDLFRNPTVAALAADLENRTGLGQMLEASSAEDDPERLASLLADLEGLSEEAVKERLREKIPNADSGAAE